MIVDAIDTAMFRGMCVGVKLVCYCLICVSVTFSSGCSMLIMSAGIDPSQLETEATVYKKFGTPVETGTSNKNPDCHYITYRTHRKISEPMPPMTPLAYIYTLGLIEFIYFPDVAYTVCKRSVVGQHLKFEFDKLGNTKEVYLNNKKMHIYFTKATEDDNPRETLNKKGPGPRIRPPGFMAELR